MADSDNRAKKIKLILFDVDGVLTDGSIWFMPSAASGPRSTDEHRAKHGDAPGYGIVSQTFAEAKGFNAHDGTGISLARLGGLKTGMVTKRISETVALRARDLKIDYLFQGADNKSEVLDNILEQSGLTEEQVAYVGDDVIDLPIMRRCGLAIAVANARPQVKAMAHYETPSLGGRGAARDAVEYVLQAQGTLDRVIDAYIQAKTSIEPK
ncbi:MAG TPA: HAD-IA family hydrolase [Candidatus Angelobacter sp.]|jgi:3-deoxy-D-manno-octulosonate 8-phosphate phosphatase (KDO 8-P phosphatase)|nr:HAD-IA family hydrolase [Candidatus Angelobacter sp.]